MDIRFLFFLILFSINSYAQESEADKAFQKADGKSHLVIKPLAEAGDPEAQYYLAMLYSWGRGIEKNSELSMHWMTKAAKNGELGALNMLASFYFTGTNTEQNHDVALNLYTLLAKLGQRDTQLFIGKLLVDSPYYEKDLISGVSWFLVAQSYEPLNEKYQLYYNQAIKQMSEIQINQAQKIASNLIKQINK